MREDVFNLVAFSSTHCAIKSEKELILAGIIVKIIPVPREITSGCGLSIKFSVDDLELVKKILEENNIEIDGYYRVKKMGLNKKIEPIF